MKVLFGHEATTSFTLWFDHHLLQYGEAYQNLTGRLYHVEDSRLPDGYYRYSSPYKQWVEEDNVGNGAHVPSFISGTFDPGGILPEEVYRKDIDHGYFIDFDNGGVVVTGNLGSKTLDLSGYFAVKDFNIYNTNETEESLIIENKFETNSRFTVTESGIKPYDYVIPAVFISNEYTENEGFSFGGEDKTTLGFKAVVFAENLYQLDGILSLFTDTNNASFPSITFGEHPINEHGDLKAGSYSYNDLINNNEGDIFYIERTVTSKISEAARNTISPSLFVGFIDFEVCKLRYPRASC